MTKGTRITPPTQAWWLGLDPINTKENYRREEKTAMNLLFNMNLLLTSTAANDSYGVYGSALHYSMVIAFVGSAFLIFLNLWRKGRLDMDEDASNKMMEDREFFG